MNRRLAPAVLLALFVAPSCSSDDREGRSSSWNESSGGGGGGAGACTTPPVYNCGTSEAGTLPCPSGEVCCLSPGCDPAAVDPYTANGAVSSCQAPVPASGPSAQCSEPAIQLCATSADCGSGYDCDPSLYYCVPSTSPSCGAPGDPCTGDQDCCVQLCCGDFQGCC